VLITGRIKDATAQRLLLKKCPDCGNNLQETMDGYECDYCGVIVDEPRYTLMIPTTLEDDTGEINVTFFNKLAEELIGMSKEEVISIVEDGNGLDEKIEDLNGLTVEIIANVAFDEYSEDIKLNPKKIISKYF
jgi:replication factor A1